MSNYCIATLSSGEKYNNFLKDNLLANKDIRNKGTKIFITTDDPEFFKDTNAEIFYFKPEWRNDTRKGRSKVLLFNYHKKRLAIKNAFDSGFNKVFYIDSDIEILNWDENFFIKKEKGFWFRTLLSREQDNVKYQFYDKLYNINKWHYFRPVSEKVIYINEEVDKINGFLNVWETLDMQANGKVNPYSEGYEILLALRFNGCLVNRYEPDPFKGSNRKMRDAHLR